MRLWFGVVSDDIEASRDFYVRLFGCEIIYEGDDSWFVLLRLGDSELGFMKPNLDSQAEIFRPAFPGQGVWITIDVDDVESEYRRLQALDAPIAEELRVEPWGDRHFVVVDPNGIGVDIVQRDSAQDAS